MFYRSRSKWRTVFGVAVLTVVAQAAPAAVLFAENFDDVTLLPNALSVRSVANILANNPLELPAGSLWAATSLNANDVNVRRADNTINTSIGSSGFDSFFAPSSSGNKFLVLGDRAGAIGGVPNGSLLGEAFAYAIPFAIGAGGASVDISFDWAFDGFDTSTSLFQQDRFLVGLVGGNNLGMTNVLSGDPVTLLAQLLLNQASPAGYSSGNFTQTVNAPQGNYLLAFLHLEANSALGNVTNSAVGIDNISATVVPVPAALPLLATALLGMGVIRRRKV